MDHRIDYNYFMNKIIRNGVVNISIPAKVNCLAFISLENDYRENITVKVSIVHFINELNLNGVFEG